jgi:hypothetical protein
VLRLRISQRTWRYQSCESGELGRKRAAPCTLGFIWCHEQSPQPLLRNTFAKRTMRWPGSGTDDDKKKQVPEGWANSLGSNDWRTSFTDPRTVVLAVAFTAASVTGLRFYKNHLRRIPSVNHIKPNFFRRKGLFGKVTSVGDADNFRLYHTPGGRIAGWGWLPWKTVPTKRHGLTNQTVRPNQQLWPQVMKSDWFPWLLIFYSSIFESQVSTLQSLHTGDERHSHTLKRLTNGSSI